MNFLNFFAQLLVLFTVIAAYELSGRKIDIGPKIFALPVIVLAMRLLGLGLGCLIASATVKYRDLNMVVGYTVNLWMFGSFVIYPRSMVPDRVLSVQSLRYGTCPDSSGADRRGNDCCRTDRRNLVFYGSGRNVYGLHLTSVVIESATFSRKASPEAYGSGPRHAETIPETHRERFNSLVSVPVSVPNMRFPV